MNFYHTSKEDWPKLKEYAREMRKEPTYCEKIIWISLRNNNLGFKFRRQYAISHFVVDFICLEKKLIIEIDGESHKGKEDYDKEREQILTDAGFKVLRFKDEEVTGNGNKVIEKISRALETC